MDPYTIIRHPLSTEKSIRLMESENQLIFVIHKSATKKDVKEAIEKMFNVKVKSVNTLTTSLGEKRAYVKFSPQNPAIDIATQMGMM